MSNFELMDRPTASSEAASEVVKSCCANIYESEWAKLLLGESFHPGGVALTGRLAELAGITAGNEVLDVASGQGTSAFHIAQMTGCKVVGVDYGRAAVSEANERAAELDLSDRVTFQYGDAERLPFADNRFDVLLCECAFCTFPDKRTAAAEFARVLKPGGRVALSDLTRSGPVPAELETLLAWIACLADARPQGEYVRYLEAAGLTVTAVEPHDEALYEMVHAIRGKLLGAELLVKLKKIDLPGLDWEAAKRLARHAEAAVQEGRFGYGVFVGRKAAV